MTAQALPASKLLSQAQSARRTGAHDRARALYTEVLARYPANRRARDGLAALERPDPGAKTVTQADLDAALTLYRTGDTATALARAEALARLAPDLAPLTDLRAACHRALGAPQRAVALYRKALTTRTGEAPLWRNLGAALMDAHHYHEAAEALEQACACAPSDAENQMALAVCRLEMGHHRRALAAADAALDIAPDRPTALNLRGNALRHLGALDEAKAVHRRVVALPAPPDQIAEARNHLGILATACGAPDAAAQHFKAAIALRPSHAAAHLSLARTTRYTAAHPHLAQLERLLDSPSGPVSERALLHFAAFEAHDKLGNVETAFAHLARGNTLRKAALGYDIARDAQLFDHLSRLELPQLDTTGTGLRPIFVLGLPRSGTTLTEQILAGAPGTRAGGELSVVAGAAAALLRAAQGATRITPAQMRSFATQVRARLTDHAQGAAVIIDKMPLNFRWAGLILAALPEARVVHVTRDATATCWSLYRTCFASGGNGFAYDLDDLAQYHGHYTALMAQWQARFAGRIIPLAYEALTAAPEAEARALVASCGLDWRDACAAPHMAQRPVLTASAAQVRRPITRGSNAAWQRYAPYLGPLTDKLGA